MEWAAIGIIVVWAIIHTVMDLKQTKRIDALEKK